MEVGSDLRYVYQFGYLYTEEILQLRELWPDCLRLIQDMAQVNWGLVLDLLGSWARPLSMRGELNEEQSNLLKEHARTMLLDLLPLAKGLPAVAQKLQEVALYLRVEVDLPIDREFSVLFPERALEDRRDWREADRQEAECVRELAEELLCVGPQTALERLAAAEKQAALVERKWPRWTPYAARIMAGETDEPLTWLATAIGLDLPGDIAEPFLFRAVDMNGDGWADAAMALLDNSAYSGVVIGIALQRLETPAELLDRALASLDGYEKLVELAIVRDTVPAALVSRLLRHEKPEVTLAAAEGVWGRDRDGGVRDEARPDWDDAVVAHGRNQYWVAEALRSDPQLAFRWAERVLHEDEASWRIDEQLRAAVGVLSVDERASLLGILSPTYLSTDAVQTIVGDDGVLFDALLENEALQPLHLVPLARKPGSIWRAMSLAALRHSCEPEAIARATFGLQRGMAWMGKESSMWKEWIDAFSPYCSDEDPGVRDITELGTGIAESRMSRALAKEHQEQVRGIHLP